MNRIAFATRPDLATIFETKQAAREHAWRRLTEERLARFPFPARGRIPNFAGADAAARRLLEHEPWTSARRLKVNPDSPQAYVRYEALKRGITVYVPTPKLTAGFNELDPKLIPAAKFMEASRLSGMPRWARPIALGDLPQMDAIVTGSACVTVAGKRCGKGAGYSDIEYGILLELGHRPAPVASTVHDIQIVDDFPFDRNDLPLDFIATPTRVVAVADPPARPDGIYWDMLGADELEAMPILAELEAMIRNRGADEGGAR